MARLVRCDPAKIVHVDDIWCALVESAHAFCESVRDSNAFPLGSISRKERTRRMPVERNMSANVDLR